MLRPSRRPPRLLLAVIGLTVGLVAAGLLSVPRVAQVAPEGEATGVPASPSISITFSQPMRADTVEGRFHADPERPGTFRWDGSEMTFAPLQPWAEGERVTVLLEGGALSTRGLPTFGATTWSFTIGAGRLGYVWPANQAAGLYLWSPATDEALTLLEAERGVTDFNLTRDGSAVVYSTSTASGSEIRGLRLSDGVDQLLQRCTTGTICRSASLSPDGALLAFLQEEPQSDGLTLRRVWVKPLAGGEPYLVAPDDHATSHPVWSSQGWLAIYDGALRGYALYREVAADQAQLAFVIPNELGEAPTWSPDGENLVFATMLFLPEIPRTEVPGEAEPPKYYSHLNRVSIVDGRQIDLSGEEAFLVEDTGAAYSPDGGWIAFSRRYLDPSRWTLGRQLWLMRADGTEPISLTSQPALNHAGLAWSPDGSRLAYMLFDQARASEPSEIWWMWSDGRPGERIVTGGYAPEWIP